MSTYALIEPVLVGLIVAASVGFSLRRAAPRLLGRRLQASALPDWLKSTGRKVLGDPADCSSGCGSCNNCGPQPSADKHVVVLHRNTRSGPA